MANLAHGFENGQNKMSISWVIDIQAAVHLIIKSTLASQISSLSVFYSIDFHCSSLLGFLRMASGELSSLLLKGGIL